MTVVKPQEMNFSQTTFSVLIPVMFVFDYNDHGLLYDLTYENIFQMVMNITAWLFWKCLDYSTFYNLKINYFALTSLKCRQYPIEQTMIIFRRQYLCLEYLKLVYIYIIHCARIIMSTIKYQYWVTQNLDVEIIQ